MPVNLIKICLTYSFKFSNISTRLFLQNIYLKKLISSKLFFLFLYYIYQSSTLKCTKGHLHERSNMHEDAFARRHFCTATILHKGSFFTKKLLQGLDFFTYCIYFFIFDYIFFTITISLNPYSRSVFFFSFQLFIIFFSRFCMFFFNLKLYFFYSHEKMIHRTKVTLCAKKTLCESDPRTNLSPRKMPSCKKVPSCILDSFLTYFHFNISERISFNLFS